jgi:ZIP family zinc transporter
MGRLAFIPALIGFWLGVLLLIFLDFAVKRININSVGMQKPGKTAMLVLAVAMHNIPEGMAVGVALASYMAGGLSLAACYALAIGIAIQNFPEGSVISFPLLKRGYGKNKAFFYGFISGVFELLGTLVTLMFTNFVINFMPYMLALAAGAMMYVIVVELIPESSDKSRLNVIGFMIGFIIMMVLDVIL